MRIVTARVLAALPMAAVVVLSGCSGRDEETRSRLLPPVEFATAVSRPGVVTVNVHVPDEGSIGGTDLWIPFDAVEARRNELPTRSTPLAVYCRTGSMSAIAVEVLSRLGYEDVVELDGGMVAWKRSARRLLPPRGSP